MRTVHNFINEDVSGIIQFYSRHLVKKVIIFSSLMHAFSILSALKVTKANIYHERMDKALTVSIVSRRAFFGFS